MQNPIIAALDVPTPEKALALSEQLAGKVGTVKIGSELFTIAGPQIVQRIRASGLNVFLDLKFHDIPNQVAKSVASAVHLDVQMLTIHTSGGSEMMRAAIRSADETARALGRKTPLILGVTFLTSLDSNGIAEVGFEPDVARQVERLAQLASGSGLSGLVCSPHEVAALRRVLPARMQFVTPGIRMPEAAADDQKRTLTPREALQAGANWLVIGRPIYAASDPCAAAERILQTLV